MIEEPAKISNARKAKFDILLTDALITLMNNMHYGKLNPKYSSDKIDEGLALPFHAETALLSARQQEKFIRAIENAQPQTRQYAAMQDKLRQLRGVYQADCYQVCEDEVVKIAINMERLRWAAIDEDTYIQINIPSYTLKLHTPDTTYNFKVVVGKLSAPTPTLNSAITYLTTTPEWKVPQKIFINELLPKALKYPDYIADSHFSIYDKNGNYVQTDRATLKQIQRNPSNYYARQNPGCEDNALGMLVFRFQNEYGIYLHDTPEQNLFQKEERPFSHSCIRVERARDLAELVLKLGSSADKVAVMDKDLKTRRTRNISLRKAMPIKITYLTCEVDKGLITTYKDVYDLDKSLEMALYGNSLVITQNK
jgi:murein L,D-transpeptidase YcbB/YkuD